MVRNTRCQETAASLESNAAIAAYLDVVTALYEARAGEPTIPYEVVGAGAAKDHSVRAWRKYRGLLMKDLAAVAGIPQGYLSEIETRRKPGSVDAYESLAKALGTGIDVLIGD
jgi:hypothetical protein